MTQERFNLLPDPRFEPLRPALEERLRVTAEALTPALFPSVLDSLMLGTLATGFQLAGAHEGTIWVANANKTHLVPAWNNGPSAEKFVGSFQQPLNTGLISMVFASEQPFCENEVYKNQSQDKTLDNKLGLLTCAMIAVPFYYAQDIRGIVSCVQVKPADQSDDPKGFTTDSIRHIQWAASVVGKLLDHRILAVTTGAEHS